MVEELEKALGKDIETLAWMTPATKKQALEKLHAITNKIGYPDKWRDYTLSKCGRDDALGNAQRADDVRVPAAAEQDRQAGGQDRVGHDAADRQRLLQPARRTTSTSRPASCSRRSSTTRWTTRSTSAASARSSATS